MSMKTPNNLIPKKSDTKKTHIISSYNVNKNYMSSKKDNETEYEQEIRKLKFINRTLNKDNTFHKNNNNILKSKLEKKNMIIEGLNKKLSTENRDNTDYK